MDVQKKCGKSLEELSEELNCTAAHMSNVKRGKSTLSLDKVLTLLNNYDYCIDDYMANKMDNKTDNWDIVEILGANGEFELLLVGFVTNFINIFHRKPKTDCYNFTPEERKQKISGRIREERKKKKISVETMCRMTQIKKMTYQNIENGSNGTTAENYGKIAGVLGVPVSFLMRDVIKNKKGLIKYEKAKAVAEMNFRERKILVEMMKEIWEVIVKHMKRM